MPAPVIYLDHHATTPTDVRVVERMLPYFSECFGNPNSLHYELGMQAADAIEESRQKVLQLIHADDGDLVFTSGTTESNNLLLKGVAGFYAADCHIITSAIEHPSVLVPLRSLRKMGVEVTILDVDKFGLVDPNQVADAIQPNTRLVSVQLANHEVGTIQAIKSITEICHQKNILVHTDAAQAIGKISVDVEDLGVDFLSFCAHKMYGPKGIGALYMRKQSQRLPVLPIIEGGRQESGLRSGTLPVPLIVGFSASAELAQQQLPDDQLQTAQLRDRLWLGLQTKLEGLSVNGHPDNHLPSTLSVSIQGIDGDRLLPALKPLAVSSGAACSTGEAGPSKVLRALGLNDQTARSTLRFGIGRSNTTQQIDQAIEIIVAAVNQLRSQQQSSSKSQSEVVLHHKSS